MSSAAVLRCTAPRVNTAAPRVNRGCNRLFCSVPNTNIGYCRLAFNARTAAELPLRARIFDSPAGRAFKESCPHTIPSLQVFGNEVYGSLKCALPMTKPLSIIPPGGLAYSHQGQYLCVFFGQAPAWPVEYFAQIEVGWEALQGGHWKNLDASLEDPLAMSSY